MSHEIQTTLGFWIGFWTALILGIFLGLLVFGVAVIGQGIWDDGIKTGRLLCQIDYLRKGLVP